jgi:hypothetical protein
MNLLALVVAASMMASPHPKTHSSMMAHGHAMHSSAMHSSAMHSSAMHSTSKMMHNKSHMMAKPTPKP